MFSADVVKELAPNGVLRAAINLGNGVLAQTGADGQPKGVTVDLARELAELVELPLELVPYKAAGHVFEAIARDEWDLAFLAIEPVRASQLTFSEPYVQIEGTYMVREDSPLQTPDDVDRAGIRIAVGPGSAYDLFLTRTIKNAEIVRAGIGGGHAMIDLFIADGLDAVAGVRQPLEAYAKAHQGFRVMPGRFQEIRQAMGVPLGRDKAAIAINGFLAQKKRDGFVAAALERSGQKATVLS
jgi:polar amino acid transport system substrate-binding protein